MTTTVLIVDDSLTVRMDLVEAFHEGGFDAVPCATVADARTALDGRAVAAAILDVMLPDGDGVDFLRELRERPDYADRPILMLSAEVEVKDRIRALHTGADEYVGKPYDAGYVVARTRELLQTRPATSAHATTVLLIDDSLTLRMELTEAMEQAGYKVIAAASGEEGLRLAADRRPDGIVVDRDLPGIDGPTVIRRIRLDAALRDLPCLLLTAATGHGVETQALDAGADAFVRKDEERGVLLAKLAATLRSGAGPAPADHARSVHGPKRVLTVHDGPHTLDGLAECLRAEGYEVVRARSGEEALDLLTTQPMDCVLLAAGLPGIDGRETCRRAKAVPALRDVPLVVVGGEDDPDGMLDVLADGADDYVRGTDPLDVLAARVRARIRRKHAHDESRRIHDELLRRELEAAQAKALATLVTELEWKNRELEAFNYSVSHDLRNPLQIIVAFSADLLDDDTARLAPPARQVLERIHLSAERMTTMVSALLGLSNAGQAPVNHERVDLTTMAHEIVADLRTREPDRKVVVEIDDGIVAEADPGLIRVVLENLLGNAWKYSGRTAAPVLELRALDHDGTPAYLVRDNGAGFSMEHAETIFDPYGRLHTASEFPGTGIGLATVHRIIARHGGRIWVQSAPGQGASFYFTTTGSTYDGAVVAT